MDSIGSYGATGSYDYTRMRQEMFNKIDSDGDGQFSLEEFAAAKPADAPEDSSEKIFSQMDSDGDGFVSEEEFANAPPPPPPPGGLMQSQMITALLESIDSDGDSLLSLEEFSAAKPDDAPEGSSEKIFAELDTDSDGYISEEELANAPPPPPPPGGMMGVVGTDEVSEESLLELLQQELENYRSSAYSQANDAYSDASRLNSFATTQQQILASL